MPENTRQREAFNAYWQLGAGRSLERLRGQLPGSGTAPSLRTLAEWSRRFHWQARLADLDHQAGVADDAARIAAIRAMADRHAKEALLLQQNGAEWLGVMGADDATPEAAIRAIIEGAKLERLARGEPTERTEATSSTEQRLEALSGAELDRL